MFATTLMLLLAANAPADVARNEVVCAETAFSNAAEQRKRAAFARFVDAEARFVSGEVLRGPDEIRVAWAAFFDPSGPSIRWRPRVVEVVAGGTLAISRGPYRVVHRDADGVDVERWGTYTSVWRRAENGAWKVLFDAGGDAGKTPTDEERSLLAATPDCPASG